MKKFLTSIVLSLIFIFSDINLSAQGYDITKGDLNNDGAVNAADASLVLVEYSLLSTGKEPTFSESQKISADVNNDGRTDAGDASLILSFYAYLSTGGTETDIEKWLAPAQITHIDYPSCKAAALYCIDDDSLIYSDDIDTRIAPASLTKLLTASVALHYLSSDTIITVGSEQSLVKSGSSLCLIRQGHKLKLYDLLTGMLMASGNDAAYTVAVTTARTVYHDEYLSDARAVERFGDLMNDFAAKIGMQNSRFSTPEGWDDANQFTTVRDLLTLSKYALSVPEMREIMGNYRKYVVFASGENITWTNSNSLLDPDSPYYCPYAIGMKTGTTADAGSCLIGAYVINGRTYISVVVGCANNADRYELTKKIISESEVLL